MSDGQLSYPEDTIAALSTPAGKSGLAVIRLSGPEAVAVAEKHLDRPVTGYPPRHALYRHFYDGETLLDEAIVLRFQAPGSYTAEDMVEITVHGNPYIVERALECLYREVRPAGPGEFTQRAFLNGRMDLLQAEAVGDLLEANTPQAHAAALQQLGGRLSERVATLLDRLTEDRAQLELEIDFTDQEVETVDPDAFSIAISGLLDELRALADTSASGIMVREGLKIGLAGAPNVGKSSLFNELLANERAIVTPIPGTTRDYLEESITLGGYRVRLFDTAGIRGTNDPVEAIGVDRTRNLLQDCHWVLLLSDGQSEPAPLPDIDPAHVLHILSKSDLLPVERIAEYRAAGCIPVSVKASDGLDELKARLLQEIGLDLPDLHSGIVTNARQLAAIRRAITALEKAVETISIDFEPELLAFDLAQASNALEEIIGKVTDDDILNRIFSHYCIGK